MSLWGKLDAKALATDVSVTNGDATVTTTGDFTDDTSADYIVAGDILSLGGVQYIVEQVTDATHLELHTTYAGSTGTVSAANALRRTAPKAIADYVVKNGFGSLVFLDEDEAVLNENRVRGLDGPGWWVYRTYTDASGNTRHKSECIVPMSVTAAVAGDFADNPAADVASAVTITGQPASATTVSGAATFTVTTSTTGTPGTLVYAWQRLAPGSTRWVNIGATTDGSIYTDYTTATLSVAGVTDDSLDGTAYRVKITSTGGTEEVISNGAATLTFGD